jgi:predicted transcriptional regulator
MESIESLTRRGATCTELLTCLYDLKQMDMEVLYETARREQATLDEISDSVKRDRSTVHRSLSKLVSLNLVYKRMRTLKDGGYYHVYMVAEESQVKKQVNLRAKEIMQSLGSLVDRFASDFHRHLRADQR